MLSLNDSVYFHPRCNKLLHVLREIHPTMLNALENIIEVLHYMKDAWYVWELRMKCVLTLSSVKILQQGLPAGSFEFISALVCDVTFPKVTSSFRYDEVLQKLYTVIQMCETEAFEIDHRQDVLNVKISQQIYKYITGIMQYLNTGQYSHNTVPIGCYFWPLIVAPLLRL